MDNSMIRATLAAAFLFTGASGCDDEQATTPDLAPSIDLAVPADLSVATLADLSMTFSADGGQLNADAGANCGASFNFTTRYIAGRTCSAMGGAGQAGASCTTSADCAEVCCDCGSTANVYMAALCSDNKCNPTYACICTDVPSQLQASNICP